MASNSRSCGAACQAARGPEGTPLTGASGGLPTRRRLPACPTRTRVQCHFWVAAQLLHATALPKRGQPANRSTHFYAVARSIEAIALRRDDATEQFLFALRHLRQLALDSLQPLALFRRKMQLSFRQSLAENAHRGLPGGDGAPVVALGLD